MPIYEYRCEECGFQDEFLQKVSEAPMTVCPTCGKPSLRKLLSAAGFQLKGSGWYATDFKGSGKPAAAKPEDKADAKPEAKGESESKGEQKSETKAETSKSDAAPAAPAAPATTSGN
jgi:putative FmdB family regulatory protein